MGGKRELSVTVKMSKDDLQLLTRAASKLWPNAIVTRSSTVLALAKLGAENALKQK